MMTRLHDSAGFLLREIEVEYRGKAKTYLTSHALADFRKCPQLYWKKAQELIPDEDRPAYAVGRAAHTLVLEGREVFERQYVVGGPINPKTGDVYGTRTKAYQEWADVQGKPVLNDNQFSLIENLRESVHAHNAACELLSDGVAEGVVRAEYCDLACQGRLDWFNAERGIVDLKTCDNLEWFHLDARSYSIATRTRWHFTMRLSPRPWVAVYRSGS
ncbi:MAG: PD-(D/E)XK nuclease-like domain-containing protein [Planctomycetes bacterium]|nr:PD-(D/E)XK nuclease-like domain-containing protein [Planctomycetota bacterium]